MIVGAIEAGGTKFVCGLFDSSGETGAPPRLLGKTSIPTEAPERTLAASLRYLEGAVQELAGGRLDGLGIGSFGPVDLDPESPTWGYITSTPKPGWRNVSVAGFFREALGKPVAFDTDVNAAALGESLWGAARGLRDFIYVTVGTGIGGGVFANGSLLGGKGHPELGHVKLQRVAGDAFAGLCPYHGDCLEGMAAGPAVGARWGADATTLGPDHEAWELEARYLARAFAGYTLVLAPERILLGGGVGMRPGLAERVAVLVGEELAGYLPELAAPERLAAFVARPGLGAGAGLYGSAALALSRP
jgi:fructokinase